MAEPIINVPREVSGHSLFIDGYFTTRVWNGEEPNYGYPPNHVPTTTTPSMKVVTGYIAALKAKKK